MPPIVVGDAMNAGRFAGGIDRLLTLLDPEDRLVLPKEIISIGTLRGNRLTPLDEFPLSAFLAL
jgi:hypothetical protein